MGNESKKVDGVIMEIRINEKYYQAGSWVKGIVYLQTLQQFPMKALYLHFGGRERIQKNSDEFAQKCFYESSYILKEFKGSLPQKSKQFPFAFKLPKDLPGTYFQTNSISIKYILRAIISLEDEKIKPVYVDRELHIIQCSRDQKIKSFVRQEEKITFFCCSYGDFSIQMESNKNIVKAGDQILLKGNIDMGNANADFQNIRVTLEEIVYMCPTPGNKRQLNANRIQNVHLITTFDKVEAGQKKDFSILYTIPNSILNSTTLGQRIIHSFVIKMKIVWKFFIQKEFFFPIVIKSNYFPLTLTPFSEFQTSLLLEAQQVQKMKPYTHKFQFPNSQNSYVNRIASSLYSQYGRIIPTKTYSSLDTADPFRMRSH